MTTRFILLPILGATDTHCGKCNALGSDSSGPMASGYPLCRRFDKVLGFDRGALRHADCISAERLAMTPATIEVIRAALSMNNGETEAFGDEGPWDTALREFNRVYTP